MCERFVSSILRYSVSCYCFSRQLISKQQWLVRKRERERRLFTSVSLKWELLIDARWRPRRRSSITTWWQRVHCHVKSRVAFIDVRATPIFRRTFYPTDFSSAGVFRSSFVFRGVPANAKSDKFYKTNRSLCAGICFRWKMWGVYCSWVFATTPSVNCVFKGLTFGKFNFR